MDLFKRLTSDVVCRWSDSDWEANMEVDDNDVEDVAAPVLTVAILREDSTTLSDEKSVQK